MAFPYLEALRPLARRIVPRAVRIEIARMRRLPAWVLERRSMARTPLSFAERAAFTHVLAEHASPLRRGADPRPPYQQGKEHNVRLAAARLDGILIAPAQVFSYHHVVGRPSRWRGFATGLELHDGRLRSGRGGGLCAVSNLLYLVALRAGMKIIERHRHTLDLFPDHGRTVPFGCGATVFYNLADLRFENALPTPVLLRLEVRDGSLHGSLAAERDPGYRIELYEVGHRFFREGGAWIRENRIRRRIRDAAGACLLDEEVAHNRGRVVYDLPATEPGAGAGQPAGAEAF
jgi:vancomycin resistance protein VanW